jgi:hypothetical protein
MIARTLSGRPVRVPGETGFARAEVGTGSNRAGIRRSRHRSARKAGGEDFGFALRDTVPPWVVERRMLVRLPEAFWGRFATALQ